MFTSSTKSKDNKKSTKRDLKATINPGKLRVPKVTKVRFGIKFYKKVGINLCYMELEE